MKAAVAVAAAAFSLTMAAVDVRARLIATTHIPDYYYHSIIDKKKLFCFFYYYYTKYVLSVNIVERCDYCRPCGGVWPTDRPSPGRGWAAASVAIMLSTTKIEKERELARDRAKNWGDRAQCGDGCSSIRKNKNPQSVGNYTHPHYFLLSPILLHNIMKHDL